MRVLGVDGGQSGIRLRASDAERVIEVAGVSRQEGDVVEAVAAAVERGWRDAGSGVVDRVVLGLTTAPPDAAGADRLGALVARTTGAPEVWIADDAVTSHAGALSLGPGVSVVAGTGVACLALPPAGPPRILGGHGYLLGDEGGGFWIGGRGLNAVLRAADGRGGPTTLTAAAEARYGPLAGLHVRLHDADRPVDAIARFAPDVLDAAAAGDEVAIDIAREAVRQLVQLLAAGCAWSHDPARGHDPARSHDPAQGHEPVPVALGGRLLAPGTGLRLRLDDAVARARLPVASRTADGTALDGSILLGLAADHRYGALVHRWPRGAA